MAGDFSVSRFIEQYILPFIHHDFQISDAPECRITDKIKNKILLADDGKDIVDLMEEALCQDSLKDTEKNGNSLTAPSCFCHQEPLRFQVFPKL